MNLQKTKETLLRICHIEVWNRCIPSVNLLNLVTKEINNNSTRRRFLESSNYVVNLVNFIKKGDDLHDVDSAFRELIIKLKQNYQKQHKLLNRSDFDIFWYSLAFIYYFEATVATFKAKNIQTLRKDSSKLLNYIKNTKLIKFDNVDTTLLHRHKYLTNFPEYKKAIEIVERWEESILILRNNNPGLDMLVSLNYEIRKQILENRENCGGLHLSICPFCYRHRTTKQRGAISTCGSDKCKSKHKKKWEEQNRPAKGRDPDGWKLAFKGEPQKCKGEKCLYEESGLRQVNRQCICRDCFRQSIAA
jgi:hypothetical protein